MLSLLLALSNTALAQDIHTVCPGGGCDFTEICAAVGSGTVAAGDELSVSSGTYARCTIGKSLTIRWNMLSVSRPIITGGTSTVWITGGDTDVTLEGFQVIPTEFRAIRVDGGASATLRDIVVTDVTLAAQGAAVRLLEASQAEIHDSTFQRNSVGGANGGHFHVAGGSALRVYDSTVEGGRAANGGAAWVSGSVLEVEGGTWDDNDATADGGHVAANWSGQSSVVTFTDVAVSGGDAGRGGGAFVNAGVLTIDGGTWDDNAAATGGHVDARLSTANLVGVTLTGGSANEGGAVYANASAVNVTAGTLSDNHATAGSGGAIRATGLSTVGIVSDAVDAGTSFDGNTASTFGGHIGLNASSVTATGATFSNGQATDAGGINVFVSSASLVDCAFVDNQATGDGGHLRLNDAIGITTATTTTFTGGTAGSGGSVFADSSDFGCTDCTFSLGTANDATAAYGGHIAAVSGGSATLDGGSVSTGTATHGGGGVYALDGPIRVTGTTFTGNSAAAGGAILADGSQEVVVADALFTGNLAGFGGAAIGIASDGEAQLFRNGFCDNHSTGVAGAVGIDGASDAELVSNRFWENDAGSNGGGLYVVNVDSATVHNNHFVGNGAVSGGGAYVGDSDVSWYDNLVYDNPAGDGVVFAGTNNVVMGNGDWFDNVGVHVSGQISDADLLADGSHLFVDPILQQYLRDGLCDDVLWLDVSSDLIDAGNARPLLNDPADTIPSAQNPGDIGAYGGPLADPVAWSDTDGDQWPLMWDCAPDDGSVQGDRTWYADADGDGFGDDATTVVACVAPGVGWVLSGGDCDPGNGTVYPGATELCDGLLNDCDGAIGSDEVDADIDGWAACDLDVAPADWGDPGVTIVGGGDCDDTDDSVFPTATELCDGQLNDCDGVIGVGEVDADADGWVVCELDVAPGDWSDPGVEVTGGGDCLDSDDTVFPGATELCDGQLNDCDGAMLAQEADDDGDDFVECLLDGDWDGPGNKGGGDCLDTDDTVYPGAPELCDGQLNDCNGAMLPEEADDDGDGFVECVLDGDWDGPGDKLGGDCDDADIAIHPGAAELCDGLVNDCDAAALPGEEVDDDGDGYVECTVDAGGWRGPEAKLGDDCDDTEAEVHPDADEVWYDGTDQDCDGNDADQDGDGFDADIAGGDDCDDTDASINPDASEVSGNGIDEDCDGLDDVPESSRTWAPDGATAASGCGCDAAQGGGSASLACVLGLLLVLRRRRVSAVVAPPQA